MKKSICIAAIVGVLSVVGCASTPDGSTELADAGDKEVCRRVDEMGSNLPKRICLKKSEWEVVDKETNQDSRALMERAAARGATGPSWGTPAAGGAPR